MRTDFGLPDIIEIEPIHSCNLKCIMCHVSDEKLTNTRINIDKLFNQLCDINGKDVIIGATHEPTMHPGFVDLATGISERGGRIWMTTNGSVLTSQRVDKIKDCNFANVEISFDAITKETCESIRRNLHYEQALERILYFKNTATSSNSRFSINYTVIKQNIEEIFASTQFWEKHGFDHIQFIIMILRNELAASESPRLSMQALYEQLEKTSRYIIENDCKVNIGSSALAGVRKLREMYPDCFVGNYVKSRNPLSQIRPKIRDSLLLDNEFSIKSRNCRAPFAHARILYNGEVKLCMKFTIGNINEKPFEEIWYGKEANAMRDKLASNPDICDSCEFYNFGLKCNTIDWQNELNFYMEGVGLKCNADQPAPAPTPLLLVEGFLGFNILDYQDIIYAIPQADGAFDIERINNDDYSCLIKASSLKEVKKLIRQELGNNSLPKAEQSPMLLVEGYLGFNILAYQGSIYAIRQSEGAFDIEKVNRAGYKYLVKGTTVEEVKQLIKQKHHRGMSAVAKLQTQELTIPQALQLVSQMFQKQELQPAEKLCRQVLRAAPSNLQAQYLLGKIVHQAKHGR